MPRPKPRRFDMVVPPAPFTLPVPADYRGEVFVWDLDKTYVRTEFKTLRELLRTALQKAKDKVTYPGAAALLRALRRDAQGRVRPIFFVSASPKQLAPVVLEKFALDGVEVDGVYFKDNLRNMRPGRFRRLREQMGYKLLALLDLRARLPAGAVETFFGDDVETDAAVYSLYGQLCRGFIGGTDLIAFLERHGVFHDEAVRIAWGARRLSARSAPERVYIQAHRGVDLRYYRRFGLGVRATHSYFETALLLYTDGIIRIEDVAQVGIEVLERGGVTRFGLLDQLDDLVRRRLLADALAVPTIRRLAELEVLPTGMA